MKLKNVLNEECGPAAWVGRPGQALRVPISPQANITTILGWVRLKADGRWNWWANAETDWFPVDAAKTREGVAATEAGAKQKVLDYWGITP